MAGGLLLSACAETQFIAHTAKKVTATPKPEKKAEGIYKIGDPYQIKSVWYYPAADYKYDQSGIASWYGSEFHGRSTANGEIYDMNGLTAAHRTLPLPSFVRVTNLENGRSLNLRVNDRGPFAHGRIIDVSRRASQLLGFFKQGTARVRVEILAQESRLAAAQMNGTTLAAADTPIIVDNLPKDNVTTESLAPPPGASLSPAPEAPLIVPAALTSSPKSGTETAVLEPELGVVTLQPARRTQIFVQAGAFAYFDNANKVRARLMPVGPVRVYPLLVDGKDLFRVRMGPISTVAEADRLLESVIQAGYPDSRIIVD